jgi:quercetin dioxygenase-like cupin family protein
MRIVRIGEVAEEANTSALMTGGTVTRQPIILDSDQAKNFNCSIVNFGRGARNKFHAHTSDQILIITSGIGIVATEGNERQVSVGDVAFIPAGEKHWHGARRESYMGHITVTSKDSQTTQLED